MKRNLTWILMIGLILMAGSTLAGSTLSIRLVEASNSGQGMGSGLGDVSRLLQENLPFKSFQLLASRSMSLPANGTASLSAGFVARCSGKQDSLSDASRGKVEQLLVKDRVLVLNFDERRRSRVRVRLQPAPQATAKNHSNHEIIRK
jgi:hypothetical protein